MCGAARAGRTCMVRLAVALLPFTLSLAAGCGPSRDSGGVVVRQVLRGAEASAPEPPPPARQTGAAGAATTQPIAPLGSTLVADTPQAVYRKALEAARRADGSTGLKQRLAAVEADMEQQQEE